MIKGIGGFNPFESDDPLFRQEPAFEQFVQRMSKQLAYIQNWQTLMNIMEFKQWGDPITQEVHLVLRPSKLAAVEHIGEAVEFREPLPPGWARSEIRRLQAWMERIAALDSEPTNHNTDAAKCAICMALEARNGRRSEDWGK